MSSRPDYATHERIYRALKERGAPGWNASEAVYDETWRMLAPLVEAPSDDARDLLELGCGAGNVTLRLARIGYRVTGIDISETAVAWARERAAAESALATFRTGDVCTLAGIPDAGFDVVVDGHCLHCIVGEDRARCLASVRRVLRPGGCFVVMTMCGDVEAPELLARFDRATRTVVVDGRPTRYIGRPEDLEAELGRAGFVVERREVRPRKEPHEQDDFLAVARVSEHAR